MNQPYLHQSTKKKKDGTSTIYLRLALNKSLVEISLNIAVESKYFDKSRNLITGGKSRKDLNLKIKEILGRASGIVRKYDANNHVLTKDVFTKEFTNPAVFVDFHAFMEDEIKKRRGEIGDKTMTNHLSTLSKMKEFKKELLLVELDEDYIKGFVKYMKLTLGNSSGTYNNALKNIKTYAKKAVQQKLIEQSPFEYYKIKKEKTVPEFLTDDEVQELKKLYNSKRLLDTHRKVLRHFLFVINTGLRIGDLRAITFENITPDERLTFMPIKTANTTKIRVEMPLTKAALQLIRDDGQSWSINNTVFKTISEAKMNKYIKEIAAVVGITKSLHFHTGRHTFATMFLRQCKAANGILILQKLLGHADLNSTIIYSHVISTDIDDAMNGFKV